MNAFHAKVVLRIVLVVAALMVVGVAAALISLAHPRNHCVAYVDAQGYPVLRQ